jgi:hypothetical protein
MRTLVRVTKTRYDCLVPNGPGTLAAVPVDARASLVRLLERLEAACERDPGDAQLAGVLLATLIELRRPAAEIF